MTAFGLEVIDDGNTIPDNLSVGQFQGRHALPVASRWYDVLYIVFRNRHRLAIRNMGLDEITSCPSRKERERRAIEYCVSQKASFLVWPVDVFITVFIFLATMLIY